LNPFAVSPAVYLFHQLSSLLFEQEQNLHVIIITIHAAMYMYDLCNSSYMCDIFTFT